MAGAMGSVFKLAKVGREELAKAKPGGAREWLGIVKSIWIELNVARICTRRSDDILRCPLPAE